MSPAVHAVRYRVRYYDAKLSREGRGSQSRLFDDFAVATEFAARHRYQTKPARVETVDEYTVEAQPTNHGSSR